MQNFFRWLSAGASLILVVAGAAAQSAGDFPTKSVYMLLPVNPGGATDTVARIMQPVLNEELKQTVVIENRPGAGGKIALERVIRMDPDGYTMMLGNVGAIAIGPSVFKDYPVPTRDLICVHLVADSTAVFVVHPSLPVKSIKDLINLAKARPGELNYGAATAVSPARLGMEIFAKKAGIKMTGIMFKGAGDVNNSLLAGEIAVGSASITAVMHNLRDGKLRALAIKSPTRSELLPNVPSFLELGFPELALSSWNAMYVPAGTPLQRVKILHAAIGKAVSNPSVGEKLKALGMNPLKGGSLDECAAFTKSQTEQWGSIVEQIGLVGVM